MAFLFDTDAISEVFKRRPHPSYLRWLAMVPRAEQYTSAISIGELFRGAFGSSSPEKHLDNIESRLLPNITVLPYDVAVARVYGEVQVRLAELGKSLADADLQIAATAIHHGLELVTGNLRHFERVPGLRIHRALIDARSNSA
jgi:predicted nucleic acid-binding protein